MDTNKAPRKNPAPALTGTEAGNPATKGGDTGGRLAAGDFARYVFRRAINSLHAELIARLECGR
jgi:hypothetical protein